MTGTFIDCSTAFSAALVAQGFSPFLGTPCGILAPLYEMLELDAGLQTVVREDNAVAIAAGAAMAGRSPVVVMQNSGFGQCVNAIASLVVPYAIPMLFIVGMRGTNNDLTKENEIMGRVTQPLLKEFDIPAFWFDSAELITQVQRSRDLVVHQRRPAALLVSPEALGWQP